MIRKLPKLHIGLRTLKTTAAVIIAMVIVDALGTTDSKLIFAMLGAMAAVQPTFKESLESCLAQVVGVIFGALCGIVLRVLPLPPLVATGIGIILVITLYNVLQFRYSPGLPCFVVVLLCTSPDVQPFQYALGRVWDTAIGLIVGLGINMLVFPYDNSRQIRKTAHSLNKVLLRFLEELFDGDDILPDVQKMQSGIDTLGKQLKVFSNQKLLLHLRRQSQQLERFRACEQKARALLAQMEVLCTMGQPGRLSDSNREQLAACGAHIRDVSLLDEPREKDIVTNYHVTQLLALRQELLHVLKK